MIPASSLKNRSSFRKAYARCRASYKNYNFCVSTTMDQAAIDAFCAAEMCCVSTDLLQARKEGKEISFWKERAYKRKQAEQQKKNDLAKLLSAFILFDVESIPTSEQIERSKKAVEELHRMMRDPYEGPEIQRLLAARKPFLPEDLPIPG